MVNLEIDDTTDDEIILNLRGSQVIVTGPESSEDDLTACLFLWQLRDIPAEFNIYTILVSAQYISPNTEENVSRSEVFTCFRFALAWLAFLALFSWELFAKFVRNRLSERQSHRFKSLHASLVTLGGTLAGSRVL